MSVRPLVVKERTVAAIQVFSMEVHWAHMGKTGGREPTLVTKTSIRRVEAVMKKHEVLHPTALIS